MRNMTRNEPSGCVMARVMRSKQRFEENFSVKQYGSWEAAEKEAKKWLKSIQNELPPAIPVKNRKTRRNGSGVVGVSLKTSVKQGEHDEWTHYSWHAFWPGKPGGSGWGINKYGDERAFICACIARQHETTDREFIESEYQRLKGSAAYRKLLAQKLKTPK